MGRRRLFVFEASDEYATIDELVISLSASVIVGHPSGLTFREDNSYKHKEKNNGTFNTNTE